MNSEEYSHTAPGEFESPVIEDLEKMESLDAKREIEHALEALLLVAEIPLQISMLSELFELSREELQAVLSSLIQRYEREGHGFYIAHIAGGYRFQTRPETAPYVERFIQEGQTTKLSAAALETLAIVAYKQPIARAQVAAIRGVSVDGVMRTLEQRGYIQEVARDPGPGNPLLFGTTPIFLEKLGLGTIEDLPPIADFVPDATIVEQLEYGLRAEPIPTKDVVLSDEIEDRQETISSENLEENEIVDPSIVTDN